MRTGYWVSVIVLAASAATLGQTCLAQDSQNSGQTDSLAAAARRARQQKKDKPGTVFTNDNLPENGSISVVGQPSAANASNSSMATSPSSSTTTQTAADASAATSSATKATSPDDKKAAATTAALAAAKEKLASVKKDLDILQRKFTLDQQTYISNPNHGSDTAGQDALDAERALINGKQEDVDAAQKEVDRLTALAPPSPDASPATPPSDNGSSPDKSATSL